MGNLLSRVGPGMMVAAVGVGVSHLVQSTRAGAEFGLSLVLLVIIVVVLKYPAFRFGVAYASATGRSLITAYARIGKTALIWMGLASIVDMFIAPAAVALVTAGLVVSIFGLPYSAPMVAVGLLIVSALVLLNGHYMKAERIIKVLVIIFSILTVLAVFFALPLLGNDGRSMFADLQYDRSLLLFVIAITGWMPMPLSGAVFQSKWICERRRAVGAENFTFQQALTDLRIGYGLTLVLAVCFVVMGTAVLFETDRVAPQNPGAFATELLSIFTTVFGKWMYPVISLAALAVMWSTLIALMDGSPRVVDRISSYLGKDSDATKDRYTLFLAVQIVGSIVIILFLMGSFVGFLDFATSMGFAAAPAIAYFNYRAVTSDEITGEFRPNTVLTVWSWISIISLTGFALSYFLFRFILV
ncbi:MAG: divalent metal cation transporter [Woeseiaceae bacterium]|jgi:Mn2+/Fe2+ NRAMP family transporter|nr:divalent metal cation transporter [Woeseiaceae bacterium]|tara:strand:- start:661 stop:1902 length:1242 start_codon:yes stop_codon:yes gene_type:complete